MWKEVPFAGLVTLNEVGTNRSRVWKTPLATRVNKTTWNFYEIIML